MSQSVIYRSARAYELLMRALYIRHYTARTQVVAEAVPVGASVLELCCGPGRLYLTALHGRTSGYIGLDVNEGFVAGLRRRGIDARRLDLSVAGVPLPSADVVIMQASLYHFLPHAQEIVDRMLAAARDRVIIAEPVRNLASSRLPIVGALGRRAANPGVGDHADRFTEATLQRLMDGYGERIMSTFAIPGGRERVYVLAADGRGRLL